MARLLLLFLLVSTSSICALAQNPNVEAAINDIFGIGSTKAIRRTGIDVVVTPDPIDSSQQQLIFKSVSGRTCNCVPYHKCDPSTTKVIEDGQFDTFLDIDLRFQVDDPVCPSSVDVCCDEDRTRNISLTPTPVDSRPFRASGCGIRNVGGIDFNIKGATMYEAGFGEFPWTVALLSSDAGTYFCAGSLIHPKVVLTVAHCVVNRTAAMIVARAGEWDSQTTGERLPFQERSVSKLVIHPQYNSKNAANDYALLILSASVTLTDHINTICLPSSFSVPSPPSRCIATGWGKDKFGAEGRFSAIMKHVPLPIVDFTSCQNQLRGTRLGPRFTLDSSFICAGGEKDLDTCQGDGGAPLFCPIGPPGENRYEQSGIVAWGIGCNQEIPAAYANVPLARNWIDEQMFANGFDTTAYTIQ